MWSNVNLHITIIFMITVLCSTISDVYSLSEVDRLRVHHERYSWPPAAALARDSPQLKKYYESREAEIQRETSTEKRWHLWESLAQVRLLPNFTTHGWQVVKAPQHVFNKLLQNFLAKRDSAHQEPDEETYAIHGPNRPLFIEQKELNQEVLHDLKPYHEDWVKVPLVPTVAYGLRLYRNLSSLIMHLDRLETHVVSCILHIAHEYDNDNEPWPLEIQSVDGSLHEVNLEPGDMVFYESAKSLHGRPKVFKGKYYASLFVHYHPQEWKYTFDDVVYSIPSYWNRGIDYYGDTAATANHEL